MGLLVLVLWILPEGLYPLLGQTTIFDPYQHFSRSLAIVWIGVRLAGAAIRRPDAEEFFWRGFLIRWLVRSDFQTVAPGTFTWTSFLITSALFAAEHVQWLAGLMAGIAYNLLWYRTRSLKAGILFHGVTNFGLGVWVLATGQWNFW